MVICLHRLCVPHSYATICIQHIENVTVGIGRIGGNLALPSITICGTTTFRA